MSFHRFTGLALVLIVMFQSGCITNPPQASAASRLEADRSELLRLNEMLAYSQIVSRDPSFFSEVAVDNFRVLAPGGLIETKDQVIAGMSAWDAIGVELTDTQVVFHGPVAIVFGRMDIDGVMRPVGRWGPLKYMSTWVRDGAEWQLLSRSLTPCIDVLIKMNRC